MGRSGELARKVASSSGKNTSQFGPTWNNKGPVNLKEDFPSLPGSAPAPASATSGPTPARLLNKPAKQAPKPAASKGEEFPGLPMRSKPLSAAKTAKLSKPVISRPISAPVQVKSKQAEAAPKVRRAPAVDPFEDDYPTLDTEPSISLSAFSRMTVKNSGQDFSYTSSETTSNIKTIDKAFLESQNQVAKSSSSSKVNLTTDFPGLGKPEKKLDLSLASGSGKKNKNKNKKANAMNNNNYASSVKVESRPEKASLSSICDFLGGTDKKPEKKVPEKKPVEKPKVQPKVEEPKVKPIVSKIVPEDQVYRPSKEKKKETQENKSTKSNKKSANNEDFPTLGGSGKKLGANFVRADDKLIKKPEVQSQWAKNNPINSKNSKENEIPDDWETIADKQKSAPPGFSKGPPGFGDQNGQKSKAKTPPGFGPKIVSENSRNPSNYKYSPPLDFQERNVKLISTITSLIGGKSLEFGMFKDISGQFRAGKLSSDSYFSQCRELVVSHKFNKFFPELLVLLPDIKKQQELFVLYRTENKSNVTDLSMCSTCTQVTLVGESGRHAETHELDSDFPQL